MSFAALLGPRFGDGERLEVDKRTNLVTLASLAVCWAGCGIEIEWGDSLGDEVGDGGHDNDLYCNERMNCVRTWKLDPRIEQAINEGVLVPYIDDGSCNTPEREWDCLHRIDPILGPVEPLRCASCPEMIGGYSGHTTNVEAFSLCWPEMAAWSLAGAQGAIAAPGAPAWAPDCSSLEPFAFSYDYVVTMPCNFGAACMGLDTECGCKCGELVNEAAWDACDDIAEAMGLADNNYWSLMCTGYPWIWDEFAFGKGGWVGTTCQFNAEGPEPGDPPMPFEQLPPADFISCTITGTDALCLIDDDLFGMLVGSPNLLFTGASFSPERTGAVEIEQCDVGSVCHALGLGVGQQIVAVGTGSGSPLDPAEITSALRELTTNSGMKIRIVAPSIPTSTWTLRVVRSL